MKEYRVRFAIDVDADTETEAAFKAWSDLKQIDAPTATVIESEFAPPEDSFGFTRVDLEAIPTTLFGDES